MRKSVMSVMTVMSVIVRKRALLSVSGLLFRYRRCSPRASAVITLVTLVNNRSFNGFLTVLGDSGGNNGRVSAVISIT